MNIILKLDIVLNKGKTGQLCPASPNLIMYHHDTHWFIKLF